MGEFTAPVIVCVDGDSAGVIVTISLRPIEPAPAPLIARTPIR